MDTHLKLDENIRSTEDVIDAVKYSGSLIQFTNEELKNDIEIAKTALEKTAPAKYTG